MTYKQLQFITDQKTKKKRPRSEKYKRISSRVRQMAKKLQSTPAQVIEQQIDPKQYEPNWYEKAIRKNQIPVECRERKSFNLYCLVFFLA